jgi:hypothetical protein
MGRMSRQKGKRGEREVVQRFIARGVPCRRAWEDQSKPGGQADGDLEIGEGTGLVGTIYAEVRFRETLAIPEWLREIEAATDAVDDGRFRALIFRRSREDWHVAVPLNDYIDLLRQSM